jgi:hypothetical protein
MMDAKIKRFANVVGTGMAELDKRVRVLERQQEKWEVLLTAVISDLTTLLEDKRSGAGGEAKIGAHVGASGAVRFCDADKNPHVSIDPPARKEGS